MIINCECCSKIFNYTSGVKVCEKCDAMLFLKIKEYLDENRFSNASEISKDLSIPLKIIKEYIKDDRLIAVRGDAKLCRGCMDVIEEGNYCPTCQSKLGLYSSLNKHATSISNEEVKIKFHTRDLYEKKR